MGGAGGGRGVDVKVWTFTGGGVTKIELIRKRGSGPNFGPFKNSTFGWEI